MAQGKCIVSLLWILVTLLGSAKAGMRDFLDDETYSRVIDEMELDEASGRSLLGLEADGDLGSRCGIFDSCNPGYECYHQRCIPNKDCLKEQMEEFNKGFDEVSYKQMIYKKSGVSEDDIRQAYVDSNRDDVKFVQSATMQSLISVVKENWQPFEPLSESIDRCRGIIRGKRRKLEKVTAGVREVDEVKPYDADERRLQASPSATPSATPSVTPSFSPSITPSAAPSQTSLLSYVGLHLEAGILFEVSLSIFWRMGSKDSDTYIRGCAGLELGASVEFLSFIVILAETNLDENINCGSALWENDVGFVFMVGFGLGVCFTPQPSFIYYEFTIGTGIGGGSGFNLCGVVATPTPASMPSGSNSGSMSGSMSGSSSRDEAVILPLPEAIIEP